MVDYANLWDAQRSQGYFGEELDEAALNRCEAKYGVKLPQSFVEAYLRQNGGVLRDCDWPDHLMPLLEDDTANFGQCIRPLTTYGERGEVVDGLEDLWDEAQCYKRIARETVQCDYPDGSNNEKIEQILCQTQEELVLFTRTTSTVRGEELAMVTLPKDIDPDWASIQPFRPEPCRTFTLHLQPRTLDDIQWKTSRRGSDGKWKNERSRGVPIYCTFESKDQARLEKLRVRLFRGKVPKKLLAEEERQRRYQSMPEEQQRAAFARDLLAHVRELDQMFAAQEADLGPVPDELKLAMGNLDVLKKRMVEDLHRRATGQTVEPAIEKRAQGSKAPPARPGSSPLSPEDEAFVSRYEALADKLFQILASVVDEATAKAACPGLEAAADEFAILAREVGTRFESEENQARAMAVQMRIVPAFMRVHEQVYRIQNGVADAGPQLYDVIQRLSAPTEPGAAPPPAASPQPPPSRQQTMEVGEGDPGARLARIVDRFTEIISAVSDDRSAEEAVRQMGSFRPENPESDEVKLVARLNEVTRRLVEALKTVQDKPTAKAALADLDRLTGDYMALYDQLLAAISRMEGVEIGILWQQHTVARAELQQELVRLKTWFRPAYKAMRHLIQRLREAYLE